MFWLPLGGKQCDPGCLPGDDSVEVKNAAILHLDIVGSTRLVQENLMLAHRQIRHLYQRICRLCRAHNGVARELRGDAAVVEFESAADAVRAAIAIHGTNSLIDATRLGRINPQIRTGLSFGPVISDQSLITGEAVIRAQRIEQLAEPGEVLIDEFLCRALEPEQGLDFSPRGARQLKGFDGFTKIYAVSCRNCESLDRLSQQFHSLAALSGS